MFLLVALARLLLLIVIGFSFLDCEKSVRLRQSFRDTWCQLVTGREQSLTFRVYSVIGGRFFSNFAADKISAQKNAGGCLLLAKPASCLLQDPKFS